MAEELKTRDFYYDLPEQLIAQTPLERRDGSRLLMIDRATGELAHRHFYDIAEYFRAGDCLVVNDTKVLPARLYGVKQPHGAAVEVLLLRDLGDNRWECIVYPGKRLHEGARVSFGDGELTCVVEQVLETGNRVVRFEYQGIFLEVLERLGTMPLPPYIREKLDDQSRYQTVYCRELGSAAAPTAGLHFTPELLDRLREKGVDVVRITLHVGLGTFRPVKVESITEHVMHSEVYHVSEEAAAQINAAKERGGRVIACGTTSCRTLESVADAQGTVHAGEGSTAIFIYPGHSFKVLDGLITNFHLPESTLIMLVSAFSSREIVLHAYRTAVEQGYRFFSFGDACLFL